MGFNLVLKLVGPRACVAARLRVVQFVRMARYVDQHSIETALAEQAARCRVRDQIKRFFGWEAKGIRFSGDCPARTGSCVVEVPMAFGRTVEVIFSNGFFVGFPPKTRGRF